MLDNWPAINPQQVLASIQLAYLLGWCFLEAGSELRVQPPIYFIHLARREDRLESSKASFDQDLWSGLRFVEAVDGSAPRGELLATLSAHKAKPCPGWVIHNLSDPVLLRRPGTGHPFQGDFANRPVPYNIRWYTQQQTAGSICCGLSHHLAWSQIAEARDDWAVVLEDDQALPSADVFRQFVKDVNDLDEFDIVYLFKMQTALLGDPPSISTPRLQPLRWQFGAQAYAISKSFAQVLVRLRLTNCLTVPDEFLNYAYNPKGHPRHEQWERCFGKPPTGRGAYVYVSSDQLVKHLETGGSSDNEISDARSRRDAKDTVDWLIHELNNKALDAETLGYPWAALLVIPLLALAWTIWRHPRCRSVSKVLFWKSSLVHRNA